jgi:hypothetical protein
LDYNNYMDSNTSYTVRAHYKYDNGTYDENGCLQLEINDTLYNMTVGATYYYLWVKENQTVPWNVPFNVTSYTSSDCTGSMLREGGILKFRYSFNVTFYFFQYISNSSSSVTPYTNQFDYVYLQKYNPMHITSFQSLDYLDGWFGWVPFYKKGKITKNYDYTETFWSDYSHGYATIKLYESGNYSIYLLSYKTNNINWPYEFIKPQLQESSEFDSKVVDMFDISYVNNTAYNIKLTVWDISSKWALGNILWAFLYIIIFLAVVIIASMINIKAGLVIGLITLPILFKMLGGF